METTIKSAASSVASARELLEERAATAAAALSEKMRAKTAERATVAAVKAEEKARKDAERVAAATAKKAERDAEKVRKEAEREVAAAARKAERAAKKAEKAAAAAALPKRPRGRPKKVTPSSENEDDDFLSVVSDGRLDADAFAALREPSPRPTTPMRHIASLQAENAALRARLERAEAALAAIRAALP